MFSIRTGRRISRKGWPTSRLSTWGREGDDAVGDRGRGGQVPVVVPLVAPEDDDVARIEREALAAGRQLDLTALAGEVLARAQLVGDAAHHRPRRQLHPFDLEAGDGFGQQLADDD